MDRMSEQKLNIEFVKEVENYPCIYDYRRTDYARKEIVDKAWVKIGSKFNLSGPQCRERWKNLRTVLSRNLRPNEGNGKSRSSRQQRKPYYLYEAMKFAVPFIKSHNTVPSYFRPKELSKSPTDSGENSEDHEDNGEYLNKPICHVKIENINYIQSRSPSPQYASPPPSPQVNLLEAASPTPSTPPLRTRLRKSCRNRKKSNDSAEMEADANASKNIKTKKAKNQNKIKIDLTKISKKRFLLSLLSDVYSMDNIQMRTFRIKILNLINEITQTPAACSVCQCNAATSSTGTAQQGQPQQNQTSRGSPERSYQSQNTTMNVSKPAVVVKIEKED